MAPATAVPVSGSKLDNRRVVAALIDIAIVGAGYAVILAAAGKLGDPSSGGALTAVGLGWALYYYFACESGDGQTVGKRVMNLRVVRADGRPAGMREIALRTILRVVDGLFFYAVGLIVMLATRERRGRLGDLLGGTMIVSAEQPAPRRMDMSAPEAPAAVSRVPIADYGAAFAPAAEEPAAMELAGEEPADEAADEQPAATEVAAEQLSGEIEADEPEIELEADEPEIEIVAEEPSDEVEAEEPTVEVDAVEPDMEIEAEELEPEVEQPDVASPSLKELASDVSALTEDPEREVEEEEPEVELPPAAEAEEALDDEAEPEEEVTVKSVETVSAIDLVMEDDEQAVAGSQSKSRRS